jgi:hypothetical protein
LADKNIGVRSGTADMKNGTCKRQDQTCCLNPSFAMPSEYILGLIQIKWKYYKFYRQSKFTIPERHRQIKKNKSTTKVLQTTPLH